MGILTAPCSQGRWLCTRLSAIGTRGRRWSVGEKHPCLPTLRRDIKASSRVHCSPCRCSRALQDVESSSGGDDKSFTLLVHAAWPARPGTILALQHKEKHESPGSEPLEGFASEGRQHSHECTHQEKGCRYATRSLSPPMLEGHARRRPCRGGWYRSRRNNSDADKTSCLKNQDRVSGQLRQRLGRLQTRQSRPQMPRTTRRQMPGAEKIRTHPGLSPIVAHLSRACAGRQRTLVLIVGVNTLA